MACRLSSHVEDSTIHGDLSYRKWGDGRIHTAIHFSTYVGCWFRGQIIPSRNYMQLYVQCEAPKIAKLVYNSNNYRASHCIFCETPKKDRNFY